MARELWALVGIAGAVGLVGLLYGIIMVVTALSRAVSPEVQDAPYKDPSRLREEFRVARLMRDSRYEPVAARGRRLRVASAVAQGSPADDTGELRTDQERDAELVPASAKAL
jgi:uncharacterized membrane protein